MFMANIMRKNLQHIFTIKNTKKKQLQANKNTYTNLHKNDYINI